MNQIVRRARMLRVRSNDTLCESDPFTRQALALGIVVGDKSRKQQCVRGKRGGLVVGTVELRQAPQGIHVRPNALLAWQVREVRLDGRAEHPFAWRASLGESIG